jgi:hypothetical protein
MRMLKHSRRANSARCSIAISLVLLALSTAAHADKARIPPPPRSAHNYEMQDSHGSEHVTIAAVPGDTKETRPNTRLDYFAHQMMPIRVIVTNDSDFDVNLDDARIHVITADNTSLPAATLDDLDRRLFTVKSATGTRLPLGLPIPITVGRKDINKQIVEDDRDFGFQTTTVKAHSTVAGWLYYDMEGVDPPFLSHATLELRKVRFAGSGQALDSFEIPLRPAEAEAAR